MAISPQRPPYRRNRKISERDVQDIALHIASATWRLVSLGGAPVPSDLVRKAQDRLGVEVAIGFGQTEASPYLTHTLLGGSHPSWMETVGPPASPDRGKNR